MIQYLFRNNTKIYERLAVDICTKPKIKYSLFLYLLVKTISLYILMNSFLFYFLKKRKGGLIKRQLSYYHVCVIWFLCLISVFIYISFILIATWPRYFSNYHNDDYEEESGQQSMRNKNINNSTEKK